MITLHILFADGRAERYSSEPFDGSEEVALPENVVLPERFLAAHRRLSDGTWELLPPAPEPEPTPEEIAAQAAEAEKAANREAKMRGIEFEGVMCSATRADQDGLTAIRLAIEDEGPDFEPTRFEFENGSMLVIHLGNYAAFMAAWRPFRKSFFKVT